MPLSLRRPLSCLIALCLLTAAAAAEEVRLSSLDLGLTQQGEGKPEVDRSVDKKPLRIAGKGFAHGFGTHASSVLHIDLKGGSTRFTAQVGIDDEGRDKVTGGSVE